MPEWPLLVPIIAYAVILAGSVGYFVGTEGRDGWAMIVPMATWWAPLGAALVWGIFLGVAILVS